ncbi:SDR family oxidoreductase [Streptomyces canus]|uniref:SDR family NAD(P)-dependent oxidoreductase n=1 Tax=Streptomyces canus TaxID=58343 RepID=UPI00037D6F6D|nr:SDR family oxidoreductase [Streptomyces canus]
MGELSSDERYCLITGATGGLGSALARVFCAAGYHTIVSGRDEHRLRSLAAELGESGRVTAITADLGDADDIRRLATETAAITSRLDAVVAAAGQVAGDSFVTPSGALERWRETVLVNVFGTAAVVRELLPALMEAGGSLFLIGSVVGRSIVPGDLYSVTKHAVSALAEAVRTEVEPLGVRVCVVQPGLMDTPMVSAGRRSRPKMDPDEVAAEILRLAAPGSSLHTNEVVLRPYVRPTRQTGKECNVVRT